MQVYRDNLQLNESECELISHPARGSCLYMCGNERYALKVEFDPFMVDLFGNAGGR